MVFFPLRILLRFFPRLSSGIFLSVIIVPIFFLCIEGGVIKNQADSNVIKFIHFDLSLTLFRYDSTNRFYVACFENGELQSKWKGEHP
jgi:hypothetical protein